MEDLLAPTESEPHTQQSCPFCQIESNASFLYFAITQIALTLKFQHKMDFQDPEDLVSAAQMIRDAYLEIAYSAPLSVKQQATIRNDPAIGSLWVSKCSLPSPKNDTSRDALDPLLLYAQQMPRERSLRFMFVYMLC
ncbi:uncharacterized protein N7503_006951 [Penicillium pulvis]|uniref:uncharacterized protein n=1 Tax=Penicillium pulvis TaxID=1562058 RepID=UPI0025488C53|nr:uncharacterized protein N7503_006951 [Penicillium pulvis]KAJ5797655.1 hypothetical protein N7503_006951 [Penicillium pulvis]